MSYYVVGPLHHGCVTIVVILCYFSVSVMFYQYIRNGCRYRRLDSKVKGKLDSTQMFCLICFVLSTNQFVITVTSQFFRSSHPEYSINP